MLPKLEVPMYEVKLPLMKKTFRFRPFLVKEEKLLLMAMESNEEDTIFNSIKQIVNNCCIDELDVDLMPITDLEFFFLNLRARSIGEMVELKYKCNNMVKDSEGNEKTCGNSVPFQVNILDIKPNFPEGHSDKLEFNEKMGVVMKYPNFELFKSIKGNSEVERLIHMIINCIDFIYDENNIYYAKDTSLEEITEFIDNLPREYFVKIQKFFETMPKIEHTLDFKCSKCGYHEDLKVEGMQNFFV